MDLVTILTACALGFKAELFIPLGALDNCSASFGLGATVAPQNGSAKIERWAAYISEAARRFGRPEAWVRAVMQAESRGAADATSPAGAIGLMQIMPETYADLRVRYGLGTNAYDPHDNIIAGTAYMSEMIELFGVPNFLAAYNAGPARLDDHLRRGRPLPAETRRYLAQIGELPVVAPAFGNLAAAQSTPVMAAPWDAPSVASRNWDFKWAAAAPIRTAEIAPRPDPLPASGAREITGMPSVILFSIHYTSSRPDTNSSNVSAPPMIGASADTGQHQRRHEIAGPSGLFVQRAGSPPATPSPFARRPSDIQGGIGGALFVPLGRGPVQVSADSTSRHLE